MKGIRDRKGRKLKSKNMSFTALDKAESRRWVSAGNCFRRISTKGGVLSDKGMNPAPVFPE